MLSITPPTFVSQKHNAGAPGGGRRGGRTSAGSGRRADEENNAGCLYYFKTPTVFDLSVRLSWSQQVFAAETWGQIIVQGLANVRDLEAYA